MVALRNAESLELTKFVQRLRLHDHLGHIGGLILRAEEDLKAEKEWKNVQECYFYKALFPISTIANLILAYLWCLHIKDDTFSHHVRESNAREEEYDHR